MSHRRSAVLLAGGALTLATTSLAGLGAPTTAAPPPDASTDGASAGNLGNGLGNGLGRLVAQSGQPGLRRNAGFRADQGSLAVRDASGRVLVQLTPHAGVDRAAFRATAERLGLVVQNNDATTGMLEGFVPLARVTALAAMPDTGTLAQSLRPRTRAGSAQSQGVALQRADRVQRRGVDGRGVTIGAISDTYDTATQTLTGQPLTVHARDDVRSGDLPGRGNAKYPTPVVVLEDSEDAPTDEGRAMLQIAHDVAPASKLCFATANNGVLGFADNIRRLADPKGSCRADVVVDDIVYFDEPMFSDGPVAEAVDDLASRGVHYFSAIGNNGRRQGWDSAVRLVPARQGVRGTNLDLSDVDPALYSGGFQDLDPGTGTDVAQDVTVGPDGGVFDLQWDDPVDVDGATYGDPLLSQDSELTAANPERTFQVQVPSGLVGRQVEFRADGIPSGSTDVVLSVTAPDGTDLGTVDQGVSPETLTTTVRQAGRYTVTVTGFEDESGAATGPFSVLARPILAPSKVTTDFNVLAFDADGAFLGSFADDNRLSGRPSEIGPIGGVSQVQLVVARAGTGPVGATRLRNVLFDDLHFQEYADPLAPATFGHAVAKGATGVAAYDPFRSYLPESYTSPGGDLPVYFDAAGRRYARPQVRRVPQIASTDAVNTTFFGNDTARDPDSQPNFGGTSAAAPHAAAVAALVLQKAGGGRSLSPARLRDRLEASTFAHDLDPTVARGSSGGLLVQAVGDQGSEGSSMPGSIDDPRFFRVSYTGKVPLKQITFYGETASPTALGDRKPPASDGIVFDPRPFVAAPDTFDGGFPFTVGQVFGGLRATQVAASFSVPAGGDSAEGQYRRMTVRFASGLRTGQGVKFGVDRDLAVSGFGGSDEGNGADELGGATFLPSGRVAPEGLSFVATRTDGTLVRGRLANRLGAGFSPVDGYGVVDAEKAVFGGR